MPIMQVAGLRDTQYYYNGLEYVTKPFSPDPECFNLFSK